MKKGPKLTAVHVHIIGAVSLVLVVLIVFFAAIRPKNLDTVTAKAAADAADQGGGNPAAKSGAERDLKNAKADTVKITADWMVYSKKYMPTIKWDKDPLQQYYMHNAINDMPSAWGNWVTKWYDAQRGQGIVRGAGQVFPVPPLASDPNSIANLTSITIPAKEPWKVNVTCKSFDEAMAHLRRFNSMEGHGMPVVNNVMLSGQSPELQLNYDLALYIIPGSAPPAADPRIGGGTGAGGAAGFGGGGFGGGGGSPMTSGPPMSGGIGMGGKGGK